MNNLDEYFRFAAALAIVLGLIFALAWSLRRLPNLRLPNGRANGRLQMVESLSLEGRARLVLVRCDTAEHLLLIGMDHSLIIESKPPRIDERN